MADEERPEELLPTEPAPLEAVLETFAPEGEGQAYLDASRSEARARDAMALLGNVAHVAAAEPMGDEIADPDLADPPRAT